jgi:prepilin-type N-terminal cleavage/methylation domain-containing protein
MRNLRNNKGFTLIELMIVVVIIGILAAIAIPKFQSVSKNAKQAEAAPILKQICTLAATYAQENGANATGLSGGATTLESSGWADPSAKYFDTWTYTPGTYPAVGSASATKIPADLKNASMNCDTKVITLT